MKKQLISLVALLALGMGACGPTPENPPATNAATNGGTVATEPRTAASTTSTPFFAVGDIGDCNVEHDKAVAQLVSERTGAVGILGDAVYESGTLAEYETCFQPDWGPIKDRLYPAPGNHDYKTEGAHGYFTYFADRAPRAGRGWYGFDVGPKWRAIVLNTNCAFVGCSRDSAQGQWFKSQLAANRDRHVLVIGHHPRYSSGKHGSQPEMKPFFRMMYRNGVALYLAGHDHSYERFAPQNNLGERRSSGVRQFVVGTGGRHLYPFSRAPLANTQKRDDTTYGVLKLRLRADGYAWRFIPTPDGAFGDSGEKRLPPK